LCACTAPSLVRSCIWGVRVSVSVGREGGKETRLWGVGGERWGWESGHGTVLCAMT
jgi:hypothetical protein